MLHQSTTYWALFWSIWAIFWLIYFFTIRDIFVETITTTTSKQIYQRKWKGRGFLENWICILLSYYAVLIFTFEFAIWYILELKKSNAFFIRNKSCTKWKYFSRKFYIKNNFHIYGISKLIIERTVVYILDVREIQMHYD